MRDILPDWVPSHVGLAYDVWAPTTDDGKVPDDDRDAWLGDVAGCLPDGDYPAAYERWRASFGADTVTAEVELASRLLVGHGNPSPTEVGLTVHHTWGVPVIPGTALKGLLAHYVETVYGPGDNPAEQDRQGWRGVRWGGSRIAGAPGEHYRALLGAPDSLDGGEALRGLVEIHDAWYVPAQQPPYEPDVLTVHQKSYYDALDQPGQPWPNDYTGPVPVAFLTVAPGTRFLLAVSGPDGWRELAGRLLLEALEQWGVGAKTSAGYGRIAPEARLDIPPNPLIAQFGAAMDAQQGSANERLAWVEQEWLPRLLELAPEQRALAIREIHSRVHENRRTKTWLEQMAAWLTAGVRDHPANFPAGLQPLVDWFDAQLAAGDSAEAQERTMAALERKYDELSAYEPAWRGPAAGLMRARLPQQATRLDELLELLEWDVPSE